MLCPQDHFSTWHAGVGHVGGQIAGGCHVLILSGQRIRWASENMRLCKSLQRLWAEVIRVSKINVMPLGWQWSSQLCSSLVHRPVSPRQPHPVTGCQCSDYLDWPMITSQWWKNGSNERMGRRKWEELELSRVKAEDKELGKSKKQNQVLKSHPLPSRRKDSQLYRKRGVCGSAHHRVWVWLWSGTEELVNFSTLQVSSRKLLPAGTPQHPPSPEHLKCAAAALWCRGMDTFRGSSFPHQGQKRMDCKK